MIKAQLSLAEFRINVAAKVAGVRAHTSKLAELQARPKGNAVLLDYTPQPVKVNIVRLSNPSWQAQDARLKGPVSENKGWSGGDMKGLTAEQIERRIGSIRSVLNDKNAVGLKFVGMNGDQKTTSPQEFLSWLEGAYASFGASANRVA